MLPRTASANRCEISSGGSDSAMDTDAYLESLIKKQKIPRTQNYNPSGHRHKKKAAAVGAAPNDLVSASRNHEK